MKNEISIFPIFNQAVPGVWESFAHIHGAAIAHNYPGNESFRNAMREIFAQEYKAHRNSFAFMAICNKQIVGFVRGWCANEKASLEHIFVLPRYQGRGIGTRLMVAAERCASLSARRIELQSLPSARTFYSGHFGYKPQHRSQDYNLFDKPLSRPQPYSAVPVFSVSSSVARLCTQVAGNNYQLPLADIRRNRTPLAVLAGHGTDLRGFALLGETPDTDFIKTSGGDAVYAAKCLRRWVENYRHCVQFIK